MSKRLFHIILWSIVGLMFVFGDAIFLFAQETETEEFTLEEITVTAQKREENQQKVAIPMEVLSGEELSAMGKTNVDDILMGISNALVSYAEGGMRVSLRGLVEDNALMDDIHVSNPTVAINVDGAFNKSDTAGQNLFDLERVEVLVGPQSTLYASNSPGGIVNVVTAAPKTDKYAASGSTELGNYGVFKANAMLNAPILTNTLAMRLALNQEKRDPYVSGSSQSSENTKSARLKTLWQPNDRFNATVTLNYTKRLHGGMMGGQVQPFDYQDGDWYSGSGQKDGKVTDPWTSTAAYAAANPTAGGAPPPGGGAPNGPNSAAQYTKGITGEINWDTGIGNLSLVPQYNKTTSDDQGQWEDTEGNTWMAYTHMDRKQRGIEARMTSAEDFMFKWIAGFNLYKINDGRFTTYNSGDSPRSFTNDENNRAVFANITYPFTDTFRGTGGYRRSWDKTDVWQLPLTGSPGMMGPTGHYGQNYTSPDYNVGVEYDMAANSMLYANLKTSYRLNPMTANQGPRTIPTEKLSAYTVGAKNRFFGNKLQLNAAAFYYDYKNKEAQVNEDGRIARGTTVYEDDIVGPDGLNYDVNGDGVIDHTQLTGGPGGEDPWIKQFGNFRSIGLDVSTDWLITSKDRMNLSISYLNAKWKDLEMVFYWHKLVNGELVSWWPSDGMNFSGWRNTYAPYWTLNGTYEHIFELGTFGTLVPNINIQYKSDYVLDYMPANYPVNYQEPYYLVNGYATFTHASGKWSINAYVKNATKYAAKNYLRSGMGFAMGITDPRSYGAILSVKF